MKKCHKMIIIGLIIYVLFASLAAFNFFNKNNNDYINYETKYVLSMIKKSEILKNEIGKTKSIKLNKNKRYPFKELGYWAYYEEFIIINENMKEYNIKIIFNNEFTVGIYAYEVDGKIIYEDIEKVQPNINELGEIII